MNTPQQQFLTELYELYDDPGRWGSDEKVREVHADCVRTAQELGMDIHECLTRFATPHDVKRMQDILTVRN